MKNLYIFENLKFDYILDTQKTVFRTLALKRINCSVFISNTASGFFLSKRNKKKIQNKFTKYYLEDLFDLLNLIKEDKVDKNFQLPMPKELIAELNNFFHYKYFFLNSKNVIAFLSFFEIMKVFFSSMLVYLLKTSLDFLILNLLKISKYHELF